MAMLDISPFPNGNFTSHSVRTGAHTEQFLLFIPLEARLARFGRVSDSAGIASLYFDKTIVVSAASY